MRRLRAAPGAPATCAPARVAVQAEFFIGVGRRRRNRKDSVSNTPPPGPAGRMLFHAIRLSARRPLNSVRIGAPGAENYERIRAHAQNAPKLFRVAAVAWHIFIFVPGGAAGSTAWLAVISKKPERRHARLHFCKLRQLPHSRIVWSSAKCRMPGERSGRSQVAAFTDCRGIRRSRAAIRRILHSPGGCGHGRIFDFRRGQEALRAPFPRNGESDLFVIIFC